MVDWMVQQVDRREAKGGGGSVESTERARLWAIPSVVKYFGTADQPRPRKYFSNPHMCCYNLRDPAQPDKLYRKPLRLADPSPEILEVDDRCPGQEAGKHEHIPIRGSVKLPGGKWVSRASFTAHYTREFALALGRAIARACFRLAEATARDWVRDQIRREAEPDPEPCPVSIVSRAEEAVAILHQGSEVGVLPTGVCI